jgi:conjugal transfer pilus assembly protein TraL
MDETQLAIPRHLDDPPRFLFWDLDEAILFMLALVLGLMLDLVFPGVAAGLALALAYGRAKSGRHRAFALHLAYWYLPVTLGFQRTPPSCVRVFVR